jgi:flagellar assembly factor FliW
MSDERFTIKTRFGDFEVTGGDVITFPRGLPGFEQTRRFV